eukprot:8998382-Heterocapsa_arctica.AAC.1
MGLGSCPSGWVIIPGTASAPPPDWSIAAPSLSESWLCLKAMASSSAPLFFPAVFSSCAGPNTSGGAFAVGPGLPAPSALGVVARCPELPGAAPWGVD